MKPSKFEELVRENEEDLQRIRKKYFPLIKERIITGYNLYPNLFDYSKGKLFLNYLHSDLKPEDRHFKELSKILRDNECLEEKITINSELVDREEVIGREADYITEPDWEDPSNIRYFDFEGNEIPHKKAEGLEKAIIGESFQYDWLIKVSNELELRKLVDLFKRFTSKDRLGASGKKIIINGSPVENSEALFGAWDIPLLIITSKTGKKPSNLHDFVAIHQFNIPEKLGKNTINLNTLLRSKSKGFIDILSSLGHSIRPNKKYTLRVFVDYIEA